MNRIRPSNMGRTILCPGWLGLANAHGLEDSGGKDADAGIDMHEAIAGELTLPGGQTDRDDYDLILHAVRFFEKVSADHAWWTVETPVNYTKADGSKLFAEDGTADVVIKHKDGHATVIDWKCGWANYDDARAVTAQGMAYALCVHQQLDIKGHVDFYLFQPRFNKSHHVAFSEADLEQAMDETFSATLYKASVPDYWRWLSPSPVACEHCPAKAVCNAVTSLLPANTEPKALAVTQIARWLDAWPVINKRNTEVRELAHYLAEKGLLPGWALKPRNGAREVKDIPGFAKAISALLSPQEALAHCKVKIGEITKTLARANQKVAGGNLKENEETIAELIAPYVERGDGNKVLTKEDA